jgi:hypothetical protein
MTLPNQSGGFIIAMWNETHRYRLQIFHDGYEFIKTFSEAQNLVEYYERLYPQNKGYYHIFQVSKPNPTVKSDGAKK